MAGAGMRYVPYMAVRCAETPGRADMIDKLIAAVTAHRQSARRTVHLRPARARARRPRRLSGWWKKRVLGRRLGTEARARRFTEAQRGWGALNEFGSGPFLFALKIHQPHQRYGIRLYRYPGSRHPPPPPGISSQVSRGGGLRNQG